MSTMEANLVTCLKGLFAGNAFFPDVAPEGTPPTYGTYQQVGGDSISFMERAVPSKANARMQINVWALDRLTASALALSVEASLVACTAFQAQPVGAAVATFDEATGYRGTLQYFSVWFDR